MGSEEQDPLTVVVRRIVKPGAEAAFESAMRAFIAESMSAPGAGDFHVIRPSEPSSREYTIVHRFADQASRRSFVDSTMYGDWMERLRGLSEIEPRIEELGGIASWFSLPGRPMAAPPPRTKMALVTFVGVYPLTSVLPGIFGGLFPSLHPLAVNVITTGCIVALLTWIVMPLLTRVFASWLFRRTQNVRSAPPMIVPLLLATGLSSCSKADEAKAAPSHPGVTVALPLVRSLVTWDRFTGRLEAVRSVEIRARVSGYLDAIHFAEGQLVAKGAPLFTIDPRPFRAALARAEAEKAEASARVAQAEATLAQATAEERAADSVVLLARNRFERAERAAKSDAIAGELVDIRSSELAQAEAAKQATTARIAAAEASIATAKAGIATAEAAIETARIDLDFTDIRAPISGRIGERFLHEGNLVQGGAAGTTLLTTIVTLDPIHCVFDADEQEFLKYTRLAMSGERQSSREAKNPVLLALVDESGYPHRGHMDFVDNKIDPNTGTIRGRAIFPNGDGLLLPGMFATVRLPATARHEFILIPDEAILTDQSDRFVYALAAGDVIERRLVELGPIVDGLRAVKSGLSGTDRVVIRGLQRVRPGTAVTPTPESLDSRVKDDGLPDDYAPVAKDHWLTIEPLDAPPAAPVKQQ